MQTKIKKLTFLKQRYILPSFANMEAVTVNAKKLRFYMKFHLNQMTAYFILTRPIINL